MRRHLLALSVALALMALVGADDKPRPADAPPKKNEAKTPAEQFKALQKERTDAAAVFRKQLEQLQNEKNYEQINKAYTVYLKKMAENAIRALELAKQEPKSDFALDAVVWAALGLHGKPEAMKEAMTLIRAHYIESPKASLMIGPVTSAGLSDDMVFDFLNAIVEKNPDKATKTTALVEMAMMYKQKAEPYGGSPPDNANELMKKAEAMFERVVKEFGTVKTNGNRTFADMAKAELFEIRNLSIGKVAPDIIGEDLDGVKFKLSDYRGKVVVLDFWGDW
jgi:hypothetical protein